MQMYYFKTNPLTLFLILLRQLYLRSIRILNFVRC